MTVIDENGTGSCSAEGGACHVPLGSKFQHSTREVLSDGENGREASILIESLPSVYELYLEAV